MVTAQRDRFKHKISSLELLLQKQDQTVTSLRSEIASLQRDNLNLYEKSRYVSTYNRSSNSQTAAYDAHASSSLESGTGGSSGRGGGGVESYRTAYETSLSPFAAFRGRESARALKRMSLPERAVFQLTKIVLATRLRRGVFAVSCVGVHVLVFLALGWMGTADVERHGAVGAGGQGVGGKWQQEGFGGAAGG